MSQKGRGMGQQPRTTLAVRRTIALMAALLVSAVMMIGFVGSTASATTVGAQLTLHGIASTASPDGAPALNVVTGDTIVFSPGPPPARTNAALLGYWVTLNSSSFPSGPDSVKLGQHSTYSMTFPSAGSFAISWTPSNTLGRLPLKSGEYTTATIVVSDAAPNQPTPSDQPTDPGQPSSSAPGSTPSKSSSAGVLGVSVTRGRTGGTGGNFHGPAPDNGVTFGTGTAPVIGFGPPASDGASRGTIPSDVASLDAPAPSASNAAAHINAPSKPTLLAVLAILVLAVVASLAAYLYFVPDAVQRLLVR
jgi:hypothetical protein